MSKERSPCCPEAVQRIGTTLPPANDCPCMGETTLTTGASRPSAGSGRTEKYPGEKNQATSFELVCATTTCRTVSVLTMGSALKPPSVGNIPPSDSRNRYPSSIPPLLVPLQVSAG